MGILDLRRLFLADTVIKNKQVVTASKQADHKLNVAIVDNFSPSFAFNMSDESVFLNPDYKSTITHGQIVRRFIEEGLPDAKIKQFNTRSSYGKALTKSINTQLGAVLEDITKKGEKYDVLNLSKDISIPFSTISAVMNEKITAKNISQHRAEIENLILSDDSGAMGDIREILQKLDKISSYGVKIYISAGNEGKNNFNLLSLAKDVKNVGALDRWGSKASYSADNSLVNSWACGSSDVKKIRDARGKIGFDFTGDGSVDVCETEILSPSKKPNPYGLYGTSYSSPRLLASDLKKSKK